MHEKLKFKNLFRIHSDEPELVQAQMAAMSRQIPLIYIIVAFNVFGLAVSFASAAPPELAIWTPAVLIGLFIVRSLFWFMRPKEYASHLDAARELRKLSALLAGMAVFLSVWCILLFPYGDANQQTHIAFFISVTLIGTVFAVVQVPLAALVCMTISGTTFVLFFATRGNLAYTAMALNFITVMLVVFMLVRSYFHNLYGFITSNKQLTEANAELNSLYVELQTHRDNLAQQVCLRTAELEEQKLKLEQALKAERELNAMQNDFVSMVSHEFRTPLAVIDGMARRVENRADSMDAEAVRERMEKIRGSVGRLSNLVERTLDASRMAASKLQFEPEMVDIQSHILDVLDRHKEIATEYQFEIDIEDLPDELSCDPRLMEHVLGNMIGNAVKYSKADPRIDICGYVEGNWAIIKVRDHGVGIPKAELARVTERFFRASTATSIQGTGIGLNLVKEIVQMHGGKFKIDSEEGKWTEVSAFFPIARDTDDPVILGVHDDDEPDALVRRA